MAGYLGEIALGHDGKTYVAQRVSPTLLSSKWYIMEIDWQEARHLEL